MSDNMIWLENPIHKNVCNFELSDENIDNLLISFDGTIMGINNSLISDKKLRDIELIKTGYMKGELKDEYKLPKKIKTFDELILYIMYNI